MTGPWLKAYPPHLDWAEPIPSKPLHSFMDEAVERFPDRPCMDFLDRFFTYAETGDLVLHAARGFQRLGVVKGTRVGLCLPNTPYAVICYYAILKAGGTVVNFNPLYTERELAQQVTDSETEILVTLDLQMLLPKVDALLEDTALKHVVVCRMREALPRLKGFLYSVLKRSDIAEVNEDMKHIPFAALIQNEGNLAPVGIDPAKDVAVLQYTGGTTGLPKGAMLTHANLSANTIQVSRWLSDDGGEGDRILAVLPLFHVFAMTAVMNLGIAKGASLILQPRFEIEKILETIDKKRPTLFPGVPTMYTAINNHPRLERYDLSSIRACISGGAPLPIEVKRRFEELTGCILVEGYGLTESSPVVTCNPLDGINKEGSIGIPLPGTTVEIRDLEDPERIVPTGEKGEVCVIGPQVMTGYWGRPGESAATLAGGRLHTGDVGFMDGEGYIFLVDRIKDLILCSGYNVYPRVIEEAIHEHPAVEEVTVIGVPDEYRGQEPKAFIKLRKGQTVTAEAMEEFLKDRLSPIERPNLYEFRDQLPKSMIGKLSKKELVAEEIGKATEP